MNTEEKSNSTRTQTEGHEINTNNLDTVSGSLLVEYGVYACPKCSSMNT